jgi:hypothetical protein
MAGLRDENIIAQLPTPKAPKLGDVWSIRKARLFF